MLNTNKSHHTQAEINLAEIMVQGLVFACPCNDSLNNCPFDTLRQCPTEVRFAKTQKMKVNETLDLYQAHSDCLTSRERAKRHPSQVKKLRTESQSQQKLTTKKLATKIQSIPESIPENENSHPAQKAK